MSLAYRGDKSALHVLPFVGVVDDDEGVRESLSSLLRSAGYRCRVFSSAEDFLGSGTALDTNCVLVDVRMPGLSGIELQSRLREMNYAVPVIFVTAHTDSGTKASALRNGARAFFEKPVNDDALLGAIRSAVELESH